MKIMTVCILGGTGFVGRQLVRQLTESGHQLRVLTRRRERHRDLLVLPNLSLAEVNIHDVQVLTDQFSGCDAVINLVGILNEKGRDGSGFRRAHVELPRIVVQACRAAGVPRLLHMSALNAEAATGRSHYLRSKGEGEDLVHSAPDLQVTSFRPSVIFGPGDSFFNRFGTLLRFSPLMFPLACPQARFAPVYVGDVASAFVQSLFESASFGQRYELCGPRIYTLKQLVEYTGQVIQVRRAVIGLGDALSRLQARILGWLPGKPFSLDNYHSLQTDSVCRGEFPALFNITPTALEAIVPS
ncbi:MAG: complex I NDUFA9 subunit family protein, partial [Gammaproteobacteria bacterium]